jgi:hypothetical protein
MKDQNFDFEILEHPLSETHFSNYDIEKLQILPLLFQTGYLTIKSYDKEWNQYELDFPNQEVSRAFSELLVNEFTELPEAKSSLLQVTLLKALRRDDLTVFFDTINTIYAAIPSHLHDKKEGYYHSIFIAACAMAGVPIEAEVASSLGRADAVLESPTSIYVIEFKINSDADTAIKQIIDNHYTDRYKHQPKPIVPVGVGFSFSKRRIIEWKRGKFTAIP